VRSLRRAVSVLAVSSALAACHSGSAPHTAGTPSASGVAVTPAQASASITTTPSASVSVSPSRSRSVARVVAPAPAFRWHSRTVTATALGKSWHRGCPVGVSQLRAVTMTIWGFDDRAHTGTLVVNASTVPAIVGAFRRIYAARFPIRSMVPIAAYGGDDNASMAADNTSAFNCRYAVANGPKQWSMHAYGDAVDIDTLENPYTLDGRVYPPAGKPYTNRSRVRRGMIVAGTAPVRAFSSVGWGWGGRWSSSPDYQHFSSNGK